MMSFPAEDGAGTPFQTRNNTVRSRLAFDIQATNGLGRLFLSRVQTSL
jgi:hypothetical protein